MPMQVQRGRQFLGGNEATPLFDERGKRAGWLTAAAQKLAAQDISVTLTDSKGQQVVLKTESDWSDFLSDNVADLKDASAFAKQFGITFQDFVEVVDDAAASADKGTQLDLSPASALSQALSLDSESEDYGAKLAKGATVDLGGGAKAVGGDIGAIGPDIMATPVGGTWDRDRTEQESWADFKIEDGATRIFKDNTGPAPFAKLTAPKWDDEEAADIVGEFNLPLHVEQDGNNPDGTPNLQDHNEMFREVYFDDASGALRKAGASVRARVRFDDDAPYTVRRVLVQAKEGREVDPTTGRSAVHKFEKRWEGGGVTEADAQKALMTGRDGGSVMPVSQKLYGLVKDAGTLGADGQLRLTPQHMVLQRRRRTHLQLDSLSAVTQRRDALQKEADTLKAGGSSVPSALTSMLKKLDEQVTTMTAMNTLLTKYSQRLPSGECFIVSADRYNVYDPASRATPPNDIDDEEGRVGRGLHIEAEWDTAASDPFENALEAIDKQLAASPTSTKKKELEADKKTLEGYRELFREDVAKTVDLLKGRLVDAGMKVDSAKKSKDERAFDIMAAAKDRPIYWV